MRLTETRTTYINGSNENIRTEIFAMEDGEGFWTVKAMYPAAWESHDSGMESFVTAWWVVFERSM